MNNNIQVFNGLKVKEANGQVMFDAESAAIGLGLTETKKGVLYVRWRTLKNYLSQEVAKGDFITEPQFYKLAIKANNETAERFQDWVTTEVLPSIRKTGGYQAKPMTPMELLETQFEALKEVSADQQELRGEFAELKEQFGLPNDLRKRFTKARNKRVVEVTGGYYGTAYNTKKLRNAVYRQLGNVIKDRFVISEFASLPMSKFDEAMRLTQNWQPDEVLTFAINGANEQALLEV
ncbi:ORF6C domain-containing protein [Weissella cibaria]|uniref:Putative phage-encoded protein n=1 Tax=Weissella cibaria TaxID=137591 RepID=A0A0D1JUP1_9LACO|nr:ORF6C domain-containing protein [Weissella cibaria]KIU24953.1 putative phage-encoded protein [Weissella cibaria]